MVCPLIWSRAMRRTGYPHPSRGQGLLQARIWLISRILIQGQRIKWLMRLQLEIHILQAFSVELLGVQGRKGYRSGVNYREICFKEELWTTNRGKNRILRVRSQSTGKRLILKRGHRTAPSNSKDSSRALISWWVLQTSFQPIKWRTPTKLPTMTVRFPKAICFTDLL